MEDELEYFTIMVSEVIIILKKIRLLCCGKRDVWPLDNGGQEKLQFSHLGES